MSRSLTVLAGILAGVPTGLPAAAAAGAPADTPAASVVRIDLPPEALPSHPVEIPVETGDSVEFDLPGALRDWAGRGFTPDPSRYAGDFEIEAVRGEGRVFVTALTEGERRILHLVFAPPGRPERSVALEFLPAPPGLSWHTVTLALGPDAPARPDSSRNGPAGNPEAAGAVRLSTRVPSARYREPGADSDLGLLRTLRLLLNRTAPEARRLVAANPALALALPSAPPRDFGDFALAPRAVLRDSVTDSLGLGIEVSNLTDRRLVFNPASWVIRAGDRVYPVLTADFAGELDPGGTAMALLVLGRGPDGEATRLLPDNDFLPSVELLGSVAARPVRTFPLGDDP